jgi:multidrug resistance efflux pump
MIILIMLIYLGCVYAAFKYIKIKVNPVSIAAAALIGVVVLSGILIGWKFSAPITEKMTVNRPVIPLSSSQNTKEVIKKVHVTREQPVKKGDLLYEVETAPFQFSVDQAAAELESAKKKIDALEAELEVATSQVEQARAALAAAKADLDVDLGIQKDSPSAISKLKVVTAQYSYESAKAAVEVAIAAQAAAEYALISAQESLLASQAKLSTAKLELDHAYIRAPADGYIMNWQASEGTMTTTVITSAQGTFQDMTETKVVAIFRQNLLKNVAAGDAVEIAFKSFPNRIATGKVDAILEFTGEGQMMTTGVLPVAAKVGSKGFLAVRIKLDDTDFAKQVPLGGAGATAIYTKSGKPFHIISKIVIRMKSWLHNLPV